MNKHMHADDCELYTILEASNINQVALDIKSWSMAYMLGAEITCFN